MAYYSRSTTRTAPMQERRRGTTLRFPGVVCDECCQVGIVGPRWKCDVCHNFDLCNDCYRSSEHSLEHAFWRIDVPETTGFKVPPRQAATSSRRQHTSDRRGRVLQERRRRNRGGMYSEAPTGFHRPSDFGEEDLTDANRWAFQEGLDVLGGLWGDIGDNVSSMLRGLEGEFNRRFRGPILDSCGLSGTVGSVGDFDSTAPTDEWAWRPSRQVYDELQRFRRDIFDGENAPDEEQWQDRNVASHRGTEHDIAWTGWECECDGSGALCASCSVASRRSMEGEPWFHGSHSDARLITSPLRPSSTRPQVSDVDHEVRTERGDGRLYQREAQVGSSAQADRSAQRDIESRLRELEAIHNCAICFDHRRDVVFTCGHGACATCARNLRTCHICRQTITQRITVY